MKKFITRKVNYKKKFITRKVYYKNKFITRKSLKIQQISFKNHFKSLLFH